MLGDILQALLFKVEIEEAVDLASTYNMGYKADIGAYIFGACGEADADVGSRCA